MRDIEERDLKRDMITALPLQVPLIEITSGECVQEFIRTDIVDEIPEFGISTTEIKVCNLEEEILVLTNFYAGQDTRLGAYAEIQNDRDRYELKAKECAELVVVSLPARGEANCSTGYSATMSATLLSGSKVGKAIIDIGGRRPPELCEKDCYPDFPDVCIDCEEVR